MKGQVTYFYNFGTPSISLKRFKLETWNLAGTLTIRGTTEKKFKNWSKVIGEGSR